MVHVHPWMLENLVWSNDLVAITGKRYPTNQKPKVLYPLNGYSVGSAWLPTLQSLPKIHSCDHCGHCSPLCAKGLSEKSPGFVPESWYHPFHPIAPSLQSSQFSTASFLIFLFLPLYHPLPQQARGWPCRWFLSFWPWSRKSTWVLLLVSLVRSRYPDILLLSFETPSHLNLNFESFDTWLSTGIQCLSSPLIQW